MKDVTAKLTGEVVVFSADSGLSPRPQSRQVLPPYFTHSTLPGGMGDENQRLHSRFGQ